MRRRDFIKVIAGAAAASPLAAHAQQPERVWRIGVLMAYAESDPEEQTRVAAFREGLQKLGWTESRNIRIDTRWAAADVELMQRFARELVQRVAILVDAPDRMPILRHSVVRQSGKRRTGASCASVSLRSTAV